MAFQYELLSLKPEWLHQGSVAESRSEEQERNPRNLCMHLWELDKSQEALGSDEDILAIQMLRHACRKKSLYLSFYLRQDKQLKIRKKNRTYFYISSKTYFKQYDKSKQSMKMKSWLTGEKSHCPISTEKDLQRSLVMRGLHSRMTDITSQS